MDNIYSLLFGALYGDYENADKAGRDTVGEYTIDTCETIDCGWETAIWKNDGEIIIVARYPDKEMATIGHANWVETCRSSPLAAYSVQTERIEIF